MERVVEKRIFSAGRVKKIVFVPLEQTGVCFILALQGKNRSVSVSLNLSLVVLIGILSREARARGLGVRSPKIIQRGEAAQSFFRNQ